MKNKLMKRRGRKSGSRRCGRMGREGKVEGWENKRERKIRRLKRE
jgi:hypothetical protein